MSSKKSDKPLHIEPRRSRHLALLLLLVHGFAISAVMISALPAWISLTLGVLVALNLHFTLQTHVSGTSSASITSMVWDADGEWSLISGQGEHHTAALLPVRLVHRMMMILNFRIQGGGRRTAILLPDSLDARTYRQLLTRLRLETERSEDN